MHINPDILHQPYHPTQSSKTQQVHNKNPQYEGGIILVARDNTTCGGAQTQHKHVKYKGENVIDTKTCQSSRQSNTKAYQASGNGISNKASNIINDETYQNILLYVS
jgi:hypothetical protein